jgi:hypothetical protein
MKIGDIISVNTIGHSGTYRIVFCYNEEPKTFLVVKPEDNQVPPACYHVLQADCKLVEVEILL